MSANQWIVTSPLSSTDASAAAALAAAGQRTPSHVITVTFYDGQPAEVRAEGGGSDPVGDTEVLRTAADHLRQVADQQDRHGSPDPDLKA
jgi:hypothetical protein